MKIFKNINEWLNNHYFLWYEETNEGFVRLLTGMVTFVLFLVLGFTRTASTELLIQIWAGTITFLPPVLAALIALFKRKKWNPWFWFPMVKGGVLCGVLAIVIIFICRRWLGC